jgi:DHA1 family multidrug resistance protein-like MFS transporter
VTGLCAGMILVKLFFNPWWQRRLAANDNRIKPEDRLPLMIAGAFVLPIGLFWFAWTSHLSVSWVAHVLSGLFIGAGAMAIFVSSVAYLVDVYLLDANSALSANRFVRFCFSAAFPLFSNYMYHRLGVDWATSLIAFLTVAMIPFPVLFWYKGEQIRGGSKLNHDL